MLACQWLSVNSQSPDHVSEPAAAMAVTFYLAAARACEFTTDLTRASTVQVAAYPTLLPATVDAMPDNLARATRLSKVLPAADWDRLRSAAYQRAQYRWPAADNPSLC